MFCIYSSLEAKFFSTLLVFDGYVIFARPVDFQAGSGKRLEHVFAVADKPLLDVGPHVVVNRFLGGGAVILGRRFAPAQQAGVVQIGVFRCVQAGAGRVVRSGPTLPMVVQVAEYIRMLLPTGRTGIERLAAGKLHTRDDKVQFMVSRVRVRHPQDIALIRLQPREGHFFKIIHYPLFLFRRYRIVRVPGKHPGGELPFGVQRIDKVAGGFHIPAQDFRRQIVTARIIRADKVMRGGFSRAGAAALAVRKNFHIHDVFSISGDSGGGGVSVFFSSRSRLTSAANTSMTSARLLWMFTHRAS